ncbi:hypothetical protein [Amycolatopsis sp. GM8]|uniref:hypothetical protein n=1 Tax=Amycolatopsis sp. GM8 TaxID=2896530 RepID=UPI001F30541A|nr:hypothetical protein [Amycolatopsis sp. GM8]
MTNTLTIPSGFSGPAGIGNGGYTSGRIAAYLDGPVTVTLRRPPPLDTPMTVEHDDASSVRLLHDGTLIAEATRTPDGPGMELPGTVSLAEADAAAGSAKYFADPLYPSCFVCGPNRAPGDGMRIFPGPVGELWAAPWTPDPSVGDAFGRVLPEAVWAALDCPTGIAAAEAAQLTESMLLGRITGSVSGLPAVGDRCRVLAWPAARDGRKLTAGSAVLGPGGEVLAVATALWLTTGVGA